MLSRYTNVSRIAIIEQYRTIASVNSKSTSNSQTLHFGDIETNYAPASATRVRAAATLVKRYVEEIANAGAGRVHAKFSKIVLGTVEREIALLKQRQADLVDFKELELLGRDEIEKLEPAVVEGRPSSEPIGALYSPDGYAIDFGKLAESFVEEGRKTDRDIDEFFSTRVFGIARREGLFRIASSSGELSARTIIAAAGAHSLLFAKSLGYGAHFAILPVAGTFWRTPKKLNGKVYTIQNPKLPFAAIHGDPDTNDETITRFGPTAKPVPLLELRKWGTFFDAARVARPRYGLARTGLSMMTDPTILTFIARNLLFDVPIIGRRAFLASVRKIVPTVTPAELHPAVGMGSIRPQLVDTVKRAFQMGEAKIIGDHAIFDVMPSPGASVCLENARTDARMICTFLGKSFDEVRFTRELGA